MVKSMVANAVPGAPCRTATRLSAPICATLVCGQASDHHDLPSRAHQRRLVRRRWRRAVRFVFDPPPGTCRCQKSPSDANCQGATQHGRRHKARVEPNQAIAFATRARQVPERCAASQRKWLKSARILTCVSAAIFPTDTIRHPRSTEPCPASRVRPSTSIIALAARSED
jgi:hypothetical protein